MGHCLSKDAANLRPILEEERPSPDFFPEHQPIGPAQAHQFHKSGSAGAGDRKGANQHVPPAPPAPSAAAVNPLETDPSIVAASAARSSTSATTTAPDVAPNVVATVHADTHQGTQHQGAHSRPHTAGRKRSSTSRRSAESTAGGHGHHQQHQPGSKASHKTAKREHKEGHHTHEIKDRDSPDQQQSSRSGKLKLQTSQVLKIPSAEAPNQQADTDGHDDGHQVEGRATSFLPPLVDMKQQRSQPQSPAEPRVMHAVPAARGGPTEPGLWVLRRTGCVHDKYVMTQTIGKGQFGIVCIAVEKGTGEKWACKSVSKRRVQGMHDFSMVDVLREVELLYLVGGHPGVVGLREVYEDEEDLHLVMELCQGGDWFEHLLTDGRYTETEAAQVVHGVLEALAYCHSLGVMHRDIKPENIMFTDRTRGAMVKLTDFGLSTMFSSEPLSEVLGSAYYVAPEVLRECYSKEADVWSLGVVLFIALGGYAPFDGKNEREVFTKILHEPLQFNDPSWDDISLAARDMISRCMMLSYMR
ncbi:kinase-like domain-containing protein [Dunaliella salina]|uniref:Kinase-like domain-containing protein n=1 Tax=Dunaliella salina TaxID=3046 RepID=A0ABQ7GRF4_DUNSA|nr:kinase-like domain-containing protein [Dunaliella salina]|eukprot:KAF5837173.1 kinase-like domain-containing protein [Dunaliella salina]